MATIVALVGDMHVNSTVGLMPPIVVKDKGQVVEPSKTQKWLWAQWLDYWEKTARYKEEMKAPVLGIINGDWGDINKYSGFELVEAKNYDVVLEMMKDAVKPMLAVCDLVIAIRGTEAHTGGSGWMENRAARAINAVENEQEGTSSWYLWQGEVDSVKMTASHHPGTNSMRPWTAGNEANRRAMMDVAHFAYSDWKPQLTLWGHYHHWANSGDTHPVQAIYNRCWQVRTAYEYKLGFANQQNVIGGAWVFCHEGKYKVTPEFYPLPRAEPWVMKLS